MSKKIFVIVNKKTGKPVTESVRLPFFWNKKVATDRSKELVNSEVKTVSMDNINDLLSVGWKPIPLPNKNEKQ